MRVHESRTSSSMTSVLSFRFDAHTHRSLVNYNLHDYDAALSDAEQSLVLDPAWMKGFHRQGLALLALKRNAEAQTVYGQALKLQPHNKVIKSCLKKVTFVVAVVLVLCVLNINIIRGCNSRSEFTN